MPSRLADEHEMFELTGALGDAGVITTNDHEIAQRCKELREYGWKEKYISEIFTKLLDFKIVIK